MHRFPSAGLTSVVIAALAAVAGTAATPGQATAATRPTYQLVVTTPPPEGGLDLSIENAFIAQLAATPAGAKVRMAQTNIARLTVAEAIVAAHQRGVDIDLVLNRSSAPEPATQLIRAALPADRVTLCGEASAIDSCIVTPVGTIYGMHNRFWTISEMTDGSRDVSATMAGQFNVDGARYVNNMVVVRGDRLLFDAYNAYQADLKAQVRTDSYYRSSPTATGVVRFLPRNRNLPDPVAEVLPALDCQAPGGAPDGRGLVRFSHNVAAQQRAALMVKLIDYALSGCTVEYSATTWDATVAAWMEAAGIRMVRYLDQKTTSGVPISLVNKAHWVDATTTTGVRLRRSWVGSAELNFLGNYALDDQFVEIDDPGLVADLDTWFDGLRSRAVFRPTITLPDVAVPAVDGRLWPRATTAGWNATPVTLSLGAGELPTGTGVDRIEYQLAGATQTGVVVVAGSHGSVVVGAEGVTTATFWSVDKAGNSSARRTATIRVDRTAPQVTAVTAPQPNAAGWNTTDVSVVFTATDAGGSGLVSSTPVARSVTTEGAGQVVTATFTDRAGNATTGRRVVNLDRTSPVLAGLPADDCTLWPPNGELVNVGTVTASDALSGAGPVTVTATSDEAASGPPDTEVRDGTVWLRAQRLGGSDGRTYTVDATVADVAGNTASATVTCVVLHDQGKRAANAATNAQRRVAAAAARVADQAALAAAADLARVSAFAAAQLAADAQTEGSLPPEAPETAPAADSEEPPPDQTLS